MVSTKDFVIAACIFLAVVVFGLSVWFTTSYFEAAAYNRITGANVSTWDAMWVELRVQEGAAR